MHSEIYKKVASVILAVYSNHGETRKCSFHFITSTSAIDFGRFFQSFRLAKGRRIRDSGSSEEDVSPHEEKVLIRLMQFLMIYA